MCATCSRQLHAPGSVSWERDVIYSWSVHGRSRITADIAWSETRTPAARSLHHTAFSWECALIPTDRSRCVSLFLLGTEPSGGTAAVPAAVGRSAAVAAAWRRRRTMQATFVPTVLQLTRRVFSRRYVNYETAQQATITQLIHLPCHINLCSSLPFQSHVHAARANYSRSPRHNKLWKVSCLAVHKLLTSVSGELLWCIPSLQLQALVTIRATLAHQIIINLRT